ncbi:hypothetical protein AB996_1201 [Lactococcus cremoris]|uniref:Uncharacterized protein n=1 Tax=Lactococcus lactis subsp. cremoris TaxID=1359 RepID=A0A166JMP6_LACLC|nr:hypothetical protein [Lactococcus cremoris]KZK06425.1 hypothetical protein AB996_1201 [Lactococcus cremoris]
MKNYPKLSLKKSQGTAEIFQKSEISSNLRRTGAPIAQADKTIAIRRFL